MPLFDFKCNKCNKNIEDLVKMDLSDAPTTCECGGRLVKQVGRISFTINGYCYANEYGDRGVNSKL